MMRRTILLLATMALTVLVASGVALAINKVGTQARDFLKGTDGADNLVGKGANDLIFGLAGKDNLLGGSGKDIVLGGTFTRSLPGKKDLVGGTGNDVVFGGKGSDHVLGNEGNDFVGNGPNRSTDKISAGEGNDVVGSFNDPAAKDVVTCGGGLDRVFADTKDMVAPDCEKVADRGSEFDRLANSIPQSFWDGLAAPWGPQSPSKPQDYVKAAGLANAFDEANVNALVGDWRRNRTCDEFVSRMKQAGLADQIPTHKELVDEGDFGAVDQGDQNTKGPCRGLNSPLAHDHLFYRDGLFRSVDQNGNFVDKDHYILPNDHTIVFPGSGSETFPPVTAHFRFSDHLNTVTFDLVLPKNLDDCSERCRGDYGWAVSVFYSGLPWHRVCQADHKDNSVNNRTDELGEVCWIDPLNPTYKD
jgi:RTX calcium-binding nonapeptide repeat (4 copies)